MAKEIIVFIITFSILLVLIIGYISIARKLDTLKTKLRFAVQFRLNNLANKNIQTYSQTGIVSNQLYTWLIRNACQMQTDLNYFGTMNFQSPIQNYLSRNFQIILCTLSRQRNADEEYFRITGSDNCLNGHIQVLKNLIRIKSRQIKNPIKWYTNGFLGSLNSCVLFVVRPRTRSEKSDRLSIKLKRVLLTDSQRIL